MLKYESSNCGPCMFMCAFRDVMIVDKVLGAWAVNLSRTDRYAACTPSRQRHMDEHGSCVCVCVCVCAVHMQSRHRQNTRARTLHPNTETDKAFDISSYQNLFFPDAFTWPDIRQWHKKAREGRREVIIDHGTITQNAQLQFGWTKLHFDKKIFGYILVLLL